MKPAVTTENLRTYELLLTHARETALVASIDALLGWDERTMLAPAAGPYRANQMSYLAGELHRRQTDPRIGQWLSELAESPLVREPYSDTGATIRRLQRQYEKKTRLPVTLVTALARTSVLGQQAWSQARAENNFSLLQPSLETTVRLKRQEAEALGYDDCAYDALLDDYEPDVLTSEVTQVLEALRVELTTLICAIKESGHQPQISVLTRHYPRSAQESFGRTVAEKIGFQFERGRLDITDHPFCSQLGPHDTRITTRYDERSFGSALFSILHEAGHGLYEQGLPTSWYGLPLGKTLSLGIHESQSRLWENFVGRGHPFWKHFYPEAQRVFAASLHDVTLEEIYFAVNGVRPSLIRTEADEATYNLHILLRFELEKSLLEGDLRVRDLPGVWNEKCAHYLGIQPNNDAEGVLQDIHWSAGLLGYFPTYSLGNVYAAQLFDAADRELGGLNQILGHGEFHCLRDWLRSNIHAEGQRYSAAELVERVTGKRPSHEALIAHLRSKLGPLYGLDV